MRKLKVIGLLTVVFACLIFLCSCTCDPSEYKWYIVSVHHDVTFANGQTLRTTTSSNVYSLQPVGISSEDVNIAFFKDGSVEFKPYNSGVIRGSYTLRHNGMKNTYFTVTFENGEAIDDGYAESYYYGRDVRFSFRGVSYEFSDDSRDTYTEEMLRSDTEWLIDKIRNYGSFLDSGVVTLEDGGARLSSDELDEDIDLFAEGIAVTSVHITDNNELLILDELREGECVFAYNGSKYSPKAVIYYVDPLPSQIPPDGPREYSVFDIIPELEYYRDHPENALLKLTREYSPSRAGEFNEHLYKTETDDIIFWLNHLAEITLTESDAPPYDIDDPHILYNMRFEDKTGEGSRVIINYECGMIKRANQWYSCDSFPTWEGGRPCYSFSCRNYSMHGGGIAGYFSISGIEFMPDPNQNYEYPEDHYFLTLEGEVGEITVYDATHFYYNGLYYLVTSEKDFAYAFS